MKDFLNFVLGIVLLASYWQCFKKMGYEGWQGIIPFYDLYLICQELYGDGLKCLLVLIPFYNIYFIFKLNIDWAQKFGKSTGFGFGMTLLPYVFMPILAFGPAVYGDGSKANNTEDFVTKAADSIMNAVDKDGDGKIDFVQKAQEPAGKAAAPAEDPAVKLKKLAELKEQGLITEEEFEAKKAEILANM